MGLSGAKVLDDVKAGASLQSIADSHSMQDIVEAVLGMKQSLRYGVSSLDEAGLQRRAGIEPWSVAEIAGHALDADAEAHRTARALAIGRAPEAAPALAAGTIPGTPTTYGVAGDPQRTREELLAGHLLVRRGGRPWPTAVLLAILVFAVPWVPSLVFYARYAANGPPPEYAWLNVIPVGYVMAFVLGGGLTAAFGRRRPPGAGAARRAER